jgi:hypothetical protein
MKALTTNISDRQIARAIVMAQMSSDAGKKIYWDDRTPVQSAGGQLKYRIKLPEIIRALRMIDNAKSTAWRYYVESTPDQNGYPSVLVYFEMKCADGRRVQISFHNPANQSQALARWIGKGRKTRWNRQIGGSRADARLLVELFEL